MQTKQQKESTMVVWCELKITSLNYSAISALHHVFVWWLSLDMTAILFAMFDFFVLLIVVKTDSKLTMRHMGLFFFFFFFFFLLFFFFIFFFFYYLFNLSI